MIVAGTGAGSDTDTWPVILNEVLGTKFKLVTGYLGTQETVLAIERGEAHGRCIFSYSALKTAKPDWLRDHKINVLLQIALEKSAGFPGRAAGLRSRHQAGGPPAARAAWSGPAPWRGRSPPRPACPANKATLLRRAFDATMKDPEFLAEASQDPGRPRADDRRGGRRNVVKRIYATPQPVIERVKKLFAP